MNPIIESYAQAEDRYQEALKTYERLIHEYEIVQAKGDLTEAFELYNKELVPTHETAQRLLQELHQIRSNVLETGPASVL
jgi:hypothetical protein